MESISLLALTLVTAFVILFDRGEACQNGWLLYGKNCFLLRNRKVHEFLGEMECQRNGGTLVTLTSPDKADYLLKQEAVIAYGNDFWVGLHIDQEGQPYWNDYNSTPAVNISLDEYQRTETNCFAYKNGTVQAVNCRSQLAFVCEQPVLPVEPVCPQPTLNAHLSDLCFWSYTGVTWAEAKASCAKFGGDVTGYRELLRGGFRLITLNYVSIHYWIKGTFKDESHNETESNPKCHTIKFNPNTVVLYIQEECDKSLNVLCYSKAENINVTNTINIPKFNYQETTTTVSSPVTSTESSLETKGIAELKYECPHGYNWKEDKRTELCYWETSYEAPRRSWEDAQKFCESYGGNLASFHNVDEEKIGLSFQYGTMQHPYWIGLKYNYSTNAYEWNDGSNLNYENWGPGEPQDHQYRRRCVQMDALSKHWVTAYCGQVSWFICKAPKQINPQAPIQPTSSPLQKCSHESMDFYLDGYCYSVYRASYPWDRARIFCNNKGADLVSVHSEAELDHLLRILYPLTSNDGEMAWIGLHSLGVSGQFSWSDGTSIDFSNWNTDEPDDFRPRRCVSMHVTQGLWSDQNCNIPMKFACKKRNGTQTEKTAVTTTIPPVLGNCEDGWYALGDRCFSVFGVKDDKTESWTSAQSKCQAYGGNLATIRNVKEQALMTFMIQNIKKSTWIGLHDRVIEGIFFWVDRATLSFSNFAPGEPTFHQLEEDCVSIAYDSSPSGLWYDDECMIEKPYICQKEKNVSIPQYQLPKKNRCPFPEGWFQHGMSCYKFFNVSFNYHLAQLACENSHAHLVSISDATTQAVIKYLTMDLDSSFWIGLVVEEEYSLRWSNREPMSISSWGYNEPSLKRNSENCFGSSKTGYWHSYECYNRMPFICQVISGEPTQSKLNKKGSCPTKMWSDWDDENCYKFNLNREENWYDGSVKCNKEGGRLASIHSMKQINFLKEHLQSTIGIHIGLSRNENGGFMWSDGTAVDFVYWDQGQPDDNSSYCVYMLPETLKWKVDNCANKKNYLCQITKNELTDSERADLKQDARTNMSTKLSGGTIATIVLSLLVLFIGAVAIFVMYPRLVQRYRPNAYFRASSQVVGFENTLYKEEMDETLHNRKSVSRLMKEDLNS